MACIVMADRHLELQLSDIVAARARPPEVQMRSCAADKHGTLCAQTCDAITNTGHNYMPAITNTGQNYLVRAYVRASFPRAPCAQASPQRFRV